MMTCLVCVYLVSLWDGTDLGHPHPYTHTILYTGNRNSCMDIHRADPSIEGKKDILISGSASKPM